jgi:hypothetical protein
MSPQGLHITYMESHADMALHNALRAQNAPRAAPQGIMAIQN